VSGSGRERDGGSDDLVCFSLVSISCLLDEMHGMGNVDMCLNRCIVLLDELTQFVHTMMSTRGLVFNFLCL
jgi:hypothetical protein